jgi:hypothetical protein
MNRQWNQVRVPVDMNMLPKCVQDAIDREKENDRELLNIEHISWEYQDGTSEADFWNLQCVGRCECYPECEVFSIRTIVIFHEPKERISDESVLMTRRELETMLAATKVKKEEVA